MNRARFLSLALATLALQAAAAQKGPVTTAWTLRENVNKMTDQRECQLRYGPSRDVWFESSNGRLTLSRYARGGIRAYRWRIDDQPASALALVDGSSEVEKNFLSWDLSQLASARRLLVEGTGIVGGPFEFDVNVSGLQAAVDKMPARCPRPAQ